MAIKHDELKLIQILVVVSTSTIEVH